MASPPLAFQNPVSPHPLSGAPLAPNFSIEDSSSSQEEPQPISSKKRYADKAQELGIIDATGAPLGTRINRKIALDKSDQGSIKESWKKPHRFSEEGFNFPWTFDQMFTLLVPYFVRTYRGTTIQMIQGVFPTVGKPFWQKQTDAAADAFITPEMWNFCTKNPHCYEFWVRLPPSDAGLCKEEILKQFQNLAIYFVAAQAMPELPTAFFHSLREFDAVLKEEPPSEENIRLNGVKNAFKALQSAAKTTLFLQDKIFKAAIEIPCGDGSFLKIIFANCSPEPACYRLDDFKLEINTEDITLVCPSQPWEAFNDHLIHRLVLSQSQPDARALGMYWVHLVLEGEVFEREKLERALIKVPKAMLPQAREEGKKLLPPGDEAFLAYCLTVVEFLERHQSLPKDFKFPDVKLMSVNTPFARLILQPHPNISLHKKVIALMGILQTNHVSPVTDAPRCRKTEICWRASVLLYLPFPGDFEKALEQKIEYSEEFLSYFCQVLEVFFPSLEDLPAQTISNPTIQEIYQTLKSNPKFIGAAVRLFVIMNKPIMESDVLDLPEWIESPGVNAFSVLEQLEKVYQRSRFFSLFSTLKAQAQSPFPGGATRQLLLTEGDLNILSLAWTRFREAAAFPFLLATALHPAVLPFALNRVCELCQPSDNPLSPEDRTRLLSTYIDRVNNHGGALSASYTPKLIEFLDPLIAADPQLKSHLSVSALATLASSRSAQEKADLKSLKDSSLLKTDPAAWWEKLLSFQHIAEERGTFDVHREEFDALFIEGVRSPSARLHTRRDFKKTFDRVARKLFDREEDVLLVSLLKQIPVTRADKIVHPWLCECLTRAMGRDPNQGAHQWLPLVTALRETGAYQYVDRPFLVKLLGHMTTRFEEITEVPFLISQVNPTQTEIPHLLDFLLEYYTFGYLTSYDSKGINKVVLGHILDDMIKHLPLFISRKDDRIIVKISNIVSVLQKAPKEAELWSKFASLFDLMKQEHIFLDGSIALLESLCSDTFLASAEITDPPFECFRKAIPRMKRLSDSQKSQLAKAYGAVVCHAVPHKRENEIIKVLPSLDWLTAQLRTDESWQHFARLFLSLHSRPSADLKNTNVAEDARWIASRVLTTPDAPLAAELVSLLLRLPPENLQPAWKPLIAGLIALDPSAPSAKKLYELLVQLSADVLERRFFERCRDSQDTQALQEYRRTELIPIEEPPTIPETPPLDPTALLRQRTEQALSTNPMTDRVLTSIFNNLKKLPATEYDLWMQFLKYLSDPMGFSGAVWHIWSQKNPIENVLPEHGKYWHSAIQQCLCTSRDMAPIFSHFLIHKALSLFLRLEGEDCRRVTTLCLKMGIAHCWRSPIKSCFHDLSALLIIMQSEPLKQKIGDPWTLLSSDSEFRFAMMLAQEASHIHYSAGHQRVILNTTLVEIEDNFTSDINRELFSCFAERPYLPRDPENQAALRQWIEKSWPCLKANLEWGQACSLVRALCMFNLKTESEIEEPDEIESAFNKWEELANGSWADISDLKEILKNPRIGSLTIRPLIPPDSAPVFFDATYALMEKVGQTEKLSSEEKIARLLSIYRCVTQNDFTDDTPVRNFKLCWGTVCIAFVTPTTTKVEEIVKIVLNDLLSCLPHFKDGFDDTSVKAAESFILSLISIMNMGAADPSLPALAKKIILQMTNISWIMIADPETKHSWPYLLYCLCDSIPNATPARRQSVALAVMDVFTECIHLPRVKMRPSALSHEMLIDHSLCQFAFYFLTLAEVEDLSVDVWDKFFQGLSDSQIDEMVSSLLEELHRVNPDEKMPHSLALARIAIYSRAPSAQLFEQKAMSLFIPTFDREKNISLQLLLRAKWILAIRAFMQKSGALHPNLQAIKQIIAQGLIDGFFLSIQNAEEFNNSSFLIDVLQDPESAIIISDSFRYPETHPHAARLMILKSLIDTKIKSQTNQ